MQVGVSWFKPHHSRSQIPLGFTWECVLLRDLKIVPSWPRKPTYKARIRLFWWCKKTLLQ